MRALIVRPIRKHHTNNMSLKQIHYYNSLFNFDFFTLSIHITAKHVQPNRQQHFIELWLHHHDIRPELVWPPPSVFHAEPGLEAAARASAERTVVAAAASCTAAAAGAAS